MTNGNKVRINNKRGVAIKEGVSKNEKKGFQLVYPNTLNNKNSLLKGEKIIQKGDDNFNVLMKILTPLYKLTWKNLEYTPGAIKMLERQFKRLHSERPHTDFNVGYVNGSAAPLKPNEKYKMFVSLVRQILVEQNNNGKVVKMYLTDFEKQKTPNHTPNERINLEIKLVEEFKAFIEKGKSPVSQTKRPRNSNLFHTPPRSRTPSPNGKTTRKLF